MTPDLPEAPGAVASPQVPGMTPDRSTVPGHEADRPGRVAAAGKRRPVAEYGTAQRIAGVYQPSGEGGAWTPKDFEQAPSTYEELRKVDPRLLTPVRPAPGYETDRALAQAEERAALAAGLPEEQAAADATLLAAAAAAATPPAPGELSSGIEAPNAPVIDATQRTTSETAAAAPAAAVANAETVLAPPVIPTDPEGTLGGQGVGQAPSERDHWAQAAPPPGEFSGAVQDVADAPDRPGAPSGLVVPDLAGDTAQDSGFGPREDVPGRPVESPVGAHPAPSAAGDVAGAGTRQPVASADAGTRTGTPAADVLLTEAARADLTGGDEARGVAAEDVVTDERPAISGTAPGGSGIAEWGASDTGLPVAEPFPRDVAPEGGPIDAAGATGAGDRGAAMGIAAAAGAGDRMAADAAAAGIVGAEAVVLDAAGSTASVAPPVAPAPDAPLAEAIPVAGATRNAAVAPTGQAVPAGAEVAVEPAAPVAAPTAPAAHAATPMSDEMASVAGAAAEAVVVGAAPVEAGAEAIGPAEDGETGVGGDAGAVAAPVPAQEMPPPPRRVGRLVETPEAGARGGAAAAVRVGFAAPQALEETGGGPASVAPATPPVGAPAMPDDADMVADLYVGDQGAPSGVSGEAGVDSVALEMEIAGIGGAPAPSVTAAPVATARGDAPRSGGGLAEDDASFGAAQPVGLDAAGGEAGATGVDPVAARVERGAAVADALGAAVAGAPGTEAPGAAGVPADAMPGNGSKFCPPGFPVKGNAKSNLYHLPRHGSYEQTVPEFCFKTPEAAEAAGFRRVGSKR